MTSDRKGQIIGLLLIVIAAMAGYMFGAGGDDDAGNIRTETPAVVQDSDDTGSNADRGELNDGDANDGDANDRSDEVDRNQQSTSGLPPIWIDELPDEAIVTLGMIDTNGPFPYSKDGSTFQNREGYLPDFDRGYYREYTVDTPGLDHRGARRIVGGDGGELYYTDDHYDSFSEIMDW